MGVKYVKDFSFPSSGGFHGDVQRYAKGGHVTKVPAKAKASAKDMPARAKPNAPAKGAPKMMSKPKVGKGQGYAEGGSVPGREMDRLPTKKPPGRGKDLASSKPFKGAYEGYADGGNVIAPMARDPFERTSGPGTPDGMKVNPRYGQPGESYYVPDMTREGMGETRGGVGEAIPPMLPIADTRARLPEPRRELTPEERAKYMDIFDMSGPPKPVYDSREGMGETRGGAEELIDVVSPLDRAAAIRRQAMMPNADLMRRAGEAVRGRMPAPPRAMPVAPRAPMVERGRPMPMEREDIVRSPRQMMQQRGQMMQQRGPRGMINRLRDQIARRVPRGEVMPQPQTIPGRQPALDIGNLPKPPPGYEPKQYIASGDIRFNPETGEYGPSIFREITDTAPPAGFVPTFEGRFAKGGRVTKGEKKISKVMGEYKRGELHSGSKKGPVVKNPKQAVAIALSEARKAGAKIPKKAEGGPLSYAESGSKAPKERSFKEAFRDAREVAKREGRDPDKEVFTWKGEKYKANLEKKVSPEKKETSEKSSRRMSSEEFVKEYEKAPASGRMKQEAYYKARPEPGAEMVSPEEAILGPKAKAALAGAGATAAGYGLKKARDFLMRRGQKARSEAADVLKGSGAMSRSAAAREAEAAAYAERLKNARRSPGMTGYAKGGEVDYTKAKDLKNKGIFNDEYLAYGDKKEPYRGSPKKAKMLGRQDRLAREAMERAEKYAPGMSLDMKAKGGLSKHEDVKMDKQLIRSAVHKHESAMHPGKAKTKLRHGGMPSYGRKPMYGGGKC